MVSDFFLFIRTAQETYELEKVDWLCSNGHKVKGVAEGKARSCKDCGQTLDEKLGRFLTRRH